MATDIGNNIPNGKSGGGSFLADVSIYGIAGILAQSLSIFLVPLYTHYLAPADYGVLEFVNQIGRVVNLVFMMNGIRIATMTYFVQAKSIEEKKVVVSSLVVLTSCTFLVGTVSIFPLVSIVAQWFEIQTASTVILVGGITILAELLPVVPFTLMQARIESTRFLYWNVGSLFVRLVATIIVVTVFHWGVVGILIARALTGLITGSILLFRELRENWVSPRRSLLAEIVRYSAPMIPVGLFGLIRNGSQRFFLLAIGGAADLGIYSLGATISSAVAMVIIMPIHRVWTAKMYAVYEREDAPVRLGDVATKFVIVYLIAGLSLVLFGKELLSIISTESYAGALAVLTPILLVGLIDTFTNIPDQVFLVCHQTKYKAYIDGVVAVLAIGIYAVGIPRFGILGAAYGLACASLLRAIITVVISRRIVPIEFEYGKLLWISILTVVAGVVGSSPWPGLWIGLLCKLLVLAAWFGSLILASVLPKHEVVFVVQSAKKMLKSFLRRD